ncbi:MAG: hypothetical protein B7733_20015 [Myxococcales bacterium FL481]|nr:MAG: hypothetical protein B7733_20015 [Myxococcales bacterium FL481]
MFRFIMLVVRWFFATNASVWIALGAASLVTWFLPLEWSYKSCGTAGADGQIAVYGFPFPSSAYSTGEVLSASVWVPTALLNWSVIAIAFYLPTKWTFRRINLLFSASTEVTLGKIGGVLFLVYLGVYFAVFDHTHFFSGPGAHWEATSQPIYELRPVGFTSGKAIQCSPSTS